MKRLIVCLPILLVFVFHAPVYAKKSTTGSALSLKFQGERYQHRWSSKTLHEFTPKGQKDLEAWTDMVSIVHYPKVTNGGQLAKIANAVLDTYKKNSGHVIKTFSIPRTARSEAEHMIVVVMGGNGYLEAVFARIKMHEGIGTGLIYSHRIYAQKAGDAMSAWLKKRGASVEKNLVKLRSFPSRVALRATS
jgi:hypothetical protein